MRKNSYLKEDRMGLMGVIIHGTWATGRAYNRNYCATCIAKPLGALLILLKDSNHSL